MFQLFVAALPLLASVASAAPAGSLQGESSSACRIVWVTASEDLPQTTSSALNTNVPINQGFVVAQKPSTATSVATITESSNALAAMQTLSTTTSAANNTVPIKQGFVAASESTSACRIVWVTALPETTVQPPTSEASVDAIGASVSSSDDSSASPQSQSVTTMQTPSQVASTQSPLRTSSTVPATRTSAGPTKSGEPTRPVSAARKNVVYFTNWGIYGANYTPEALPANEITHLLYAFGDISSDGEVISSDPFADVQKIFENPVQKRDVADQGETAHGCVEQLYKLKEKNRNLKNLLSIGGFSYSQAGKFAPATKTAEGRRRFAQSAVKLVSNWGFDGIDIDWEYPQTKEEAHEFVELLNETRSALDEYASSNGQEYHYLLTAATSAGPSHYTLLDLKAMDQYLDIWNLMAYDYAGSWDNTTGNQANVYSDPDNEASTKFSTDKAVDYYIAAGIAPEKIVLGMPLYGRSFLNTTGIGQKYVGVGEGPTGAGVWPYKDLPLPGSTVTVNKEIIAAYSYDPKTGMLVSYDNEETAGLKAKYLLEKGLGGAVFWEASGDKTGKDSLIATMARSMWPLEDAPNMLEYPRSEFSNIRS